MRALRCPSIVAYGCRYSVHPVRRIFTFTHLRLHRHRHLRHRRHLRSLQPSAVSLFRRLDNLSPFVTGKCPFFRMEGYLILYLLLIVSCGAYCAPDPQHPPFPEILDCKHEHAGSLHLEALQSMVSNPSLLNERFWSGSNLNRNQGMVASLQRYGVISSKKVAEVMETIDRGLFVPDGTPAYVDSPMPIGYNATISAPHMHAMCLQLLEKNLQPGMHALDVGSGTGYLTACFAMMVGSEGRAVGVEHIPELVASSIKNIEKSAAAPLMKEGSLAVHVGDGRLGWPEFAPYDAIHVGAAAFDIPQALIDQLKPGGRMVIPVGNFFQDLKVVDKELDGSVSIRSETSVRYVPLTSREEQLRGF